MTRESEIAGKRLLLVDDDKDFLQIMTRSLTRKGFEVLAANSLESAKKYLRQEIDFAVVDLMIGRESGLTLIPKLKSANPAMRIVLLTGYASILTAVEAIKLGANNYLAKPAGVDELLEKLIRDVPLRKLSAVREAPPFEQVEWEHIQKALHDCNGNISATARLLRMHRRTLQRKLASPPDGVFPQ